MLTYVFKLQKSDNEKYLEQNLDIACEVWNHCVAVERHCYRMFGKYVGKYRLMNHVVELKRGKFAHWRKLDAQSIQEVIERIDRAYMDYFAYIKSGKHGKVSPPHLRTRNEYRSFTLKQSGYKINGNRIYITGKRFKFFKSREIKGSVKRITVKKSSAGEWFIFVTTDYDPVRNFPETQNAVGIDFGMKDFLVLSTGEKISSPEFFKKSMPEVRIVTRNLYRKELGSNNRERARIKAAKLYEHIADQRRDFFFKLANELCQKYDIIGVEDLNLNGMRALWGRKSSDLAYGEFLLILEYVASTSGKKVVRVDRWSPTSKTCSACGGQKELSLKEREWTCPHCGKKHDRDINAAINIRNLALSVTSGWKSEQTAK